MYLRKLHGGKSHHVVSAGGIIQASCANHFFLKLFLFLFFFRKPCCRSAGSCTDCYQWLYEIL